MSLEIAPRKKCLRTRRSKEIITPLPAAASPSDRRQPFSSRLSRDSLPPPVLKGLLGDHEMASRDLIPGPGQSPSRGQAVVIAIPAEEALVCPNQLRNNV